MLKHFIVKHREIIIFLSTGLMSTLLSWFIFWIGTLFLDIEGSWFQNALCNTMKWVVTLCFGYFANRIFVFQSQSAKILKEFLEFGFCRLSILALDIRVMWLTVNLLQWDKWFSVIFISTPMITIANYYICKYVVFNKQKEPQKAI